MEVVVLYQGRPRETGLGSFAWDEVTGENGPVPIIWTLSEPVGAREWWPCKDRPDDKADSVDVILRAPGWMTPTSNGVVVDMIPEEDGSHTLHWQTRYPMTTYLVSVAATEFQWIYDVYEYEPGKTMPIEHYVYPRLREEAEEDFSITPEVLGFLAERFGPYPFLEEKYGHALFPYGGAMEHQTNTSYGHYLVTGTHRNDWVLVHEAAHQWWGDMTSPADWKDIWLNEGFASYAEALWFEYLEGFEAYREYMTDNQLVIDPSGPIYDPVNLFSGNVVYNKGAWVVHMLRGILGDETFYDALTAYREATEFRSTTTAEFQSIVEEVAGQNLDWFFQSWIYGVNRPHYAVSFLPVEEAAEHRVAVHLEQTQVDWGFFTMPLDLEVELAGGGVVRQRVWNDPDHLDFEFSVPAAATEIRVDPDDWVLKRVNAVPYTMHITSLELPAGTEGREFNADLVVRGGTAPFAWSSADLSSLGMQLDPSSGEILGFAPGPGEYSLMVRVRDASNRIDEQRIAWWVEADTLSEPPVPTVDTKLDFEAWPVPARDLLSLSVSAPPDVSVRLTAFDVTGRKIRDIYRGLTPSEPVIWNGRDDAGEPVSSGLYLVRMQSSGLTRDRRVVWLR